MDTPLTELCQDLRNWFDKERYSGTFTISSYKLDAPFLKEGQYYRIIGSVFNDGIHQYFTKSRDVSLQDETFTGEVWALAIPKDVIQLAQDIAEWRAKYEAVDSQAMSPYMSESFGGYSYTKGSAYTGAGSGGGTSWKATFKSRLTPWRKL